ncbi:hypothetical protein Sme01_35140 [Sphaerisporangium melleum]|uniref:Uncharacterized protein n=1 Tax=Sphaerisporangium melleum TaxID=321316 RepID=A0A917RA42_9ACTN|nr:hypothetical protein GCM10007964_43790 [Sphaerisporangium melleum]GII71038.1 hypothetical protein Sme01_35140 [Sphaerisporangium melleum]
MSSVSSAAASDALAASWSSRAIVSSTRASTCPARTFWPADTYTFSTVPSAPKARSRSWASTVLPAAETPLTIVPRLAEASSTRVVAGVLASPR